MMAAMNTVNHKPGYASAEEAESAFYAAFAGLSFVAMERVWAPEDIACLHPGGELLQGRKAVLDSWARILNAPEGPQLQFERDMVQGESDFRLHMVRELIAPAAGEQAVVVQAVNAYRKIDGGWYLVLHHATIPVATAAAPTSSEHTTSRQLQ